MNSHEISLPMPFLCSQALETIQNPSYNYEGKDFDSIIPLLTSIEFFRNNFKSPEKLHDFLQVARPQIIHEVYPYGSVLLKENEHADKLYIILSGDVQKLCQRPSHTLERELKKMRRSNLRIPVNCTRSESSRQGSKTAQVKRKSGGFLYDLRKVTSMKKLTIEPLFKVPARPEIKIFRAPERSETSQEDVKSEKKVITAKDVRKDFDLTHLNVPLNVVRRDSMVKFHRAGPKHFTDEPYIGTRLDLSAETINNSGCNNARLSVGTRLSINEEIVPACEDQTAEHVIFVKQISSRCPEIENRCLIEGVSRLNSTRTLTVGDCFGETFTNQQIKEKSIIAVSSQEAHFLTLTKDSYESISAKLDRIADEKLLGLARIFPSISHEDLKRFTQYFGRKVFKKGETIYKQGEPARELYFLHTGDIRLFKENTTTSAGIAPIRRQSSFRKIGVSTNSINSGGFFGEELILDQKSRQYTTFVNTHDAVVFFLTADSYSKIKENFADVFKILHRQTEEKHACKQDKIDEPFEKYQSKSHKSSSMVIQPERRKSITSSPKTSRHIGSWDELMTPKRRENAIDSDIKKTTGEASHASKSVARRSNKAFTDSSPALNKNMEIYMNKFSRKIGVTGVQSQLIINEAISLAREEERSNIFTKSPCKNGSIVFNVMRELDYVEEKKAKLPRISSCTSIGFSRKDSETPKSAALMLSKLSSSPGLATSRNFEQTKTPLFISSPMTLRLK